MSDRAASLSPQIQILQTVYSAITARLLTVATELGIPDLLSAGPRAAPELAVATGVDADALYRVLRTLASVGIFTETERGIFALTELAEVLRADAPGSIRDVILELGSAETFATLARFDHSVRTGEPAFDQAYGTDWWRWLKDRPDRAEIFNRTQAITARQIHSRALDPYDMAGAKRIVDVGGGHGVLVARMLQRYPRLTGVVFDQPDVVTGAEATLAEAGVLDRAEVIGGDFFASVPAGGDLYLLSMILHDWDDGPAAAILTNVRKAMAPGARVLIIDAVIPEGNVRHTAKFIDIFMLMYYSGRERTAAQFAELLDVAGLRLAEKHNSSAPTSLIVAESTDPSR
jgi:predicted O-methyltransferase YrrM